MRLSRIALVLLPLTLGAATPGPAGEAPGDVVAQRGDVKFTAADVRDMVEHADPTVRAQVQSNPAALAEFVRDRLLRQTLLNEAHAAKWDENPEVLAQIKQARDTVVVQSYLASKVPADPGYPSQADIQAAYQANQARFATPKQYHLEQIAILVPPGASKEVEEAARKKALTLKLDSMKPKADFSEMAKKNSQDRASADKGGDMGWLREDVLVPPVREAVAGVPDNTIVGPVRSAEAWHVIKVLGVKPPGVLPLDQVRASLAAAMQQNRVQQLARAYVENLLKQQPIQLNEIELAKRVSATQ